MSLSIIGIIVALICLMILVYKKVNIILASIICCLITAFFSGLPLLTSLKESYMPGFAEFIINNFLIFHLVLYSENSWKFLVPLHPSPK